jgi:type IV pilus assembly protein PilM
MIRTRSSFGMSSPTVAVEIARHRVSAASIVPRDGRLTIAAHAIEVLPEGAVTPGLNAQNIPDVQALSEVLRRALDRIGSRPRRVALAVPDSVAKVSLLRFEKVPERARDLDELVRWQVRKAAPFRLEDAQVSYVPGVEPPDGGREYVVVLARRDIIEQYEAVCAGAGAQAGLVDLSTFNVINAVLATPRPPTGDWLLVHVTPEDATMAILRGPHLVFFRNRGAEGEGSLADLVHQTAMYYEDRLSGTGFTRVMLVGGGSSPAGAGRDTEYLRRALEERLAITVGAIDTREAAALADRISAAPDLLDALAPLVGLVVRDRAS